MFEVGISIRKWEKQQKRSMLQSPDFKAKLQWGRYSNTIAGVLDTMLGIACDILYCSPVWSASKGSGYCGRWTATGQAKHHTSTRRARKRTGKLHTERVNEQILPEWSPEHTKAKKVAGNHLDSFTKGKSSLTNMVSGSAGKGRAADV